jgi:hypothetical protein
MFLSDIVNKPQTSEDTKALDKYRENSAFVEIAAPTRKLPNLQHASSAGHPMAGHGIKNDPYKVSNAIIMEINNMAGQLFELTNQLNKLMMYKPKRITKYLGDKYQRRLEEKYGENILRNVIKTSDFSFPSEDYTG